MSDGTDQIRFLDPATFTVMRTIDVKSQGQPLRMLNELEYIKGEIFANVWQTPFLSELTGNRIGFGRDRLFRSARSGGLRCPRRFLNGIAYDAAGDRLFVTGKNWPKLFEVKLKLQKRS